MTTTTQSISTETVLKLLADPQRRKILQAVGASNTPMSVEQLVESATEVSGASTQDASREQRATAVRHNHLPKLQDADVIEYDRHRQRLQRGEQFEATTSLLAVISEHRDDVSFYRTDAC
ncbi:ArsR/SmtB family transcription factor [Halovenus marina]|uniref:ArsR/SmtB family transcription factor n=1 Tax=Halovenus marina TaxID=3396621 RepID=UPI003F5594DE